MLTVEDRSHDIVYWSIGSFCNLKNYYVQSVHIVLSTELFFRSDNIASLDGM